MRASTPGQLQAVRRGKSANLGTDRPVSRRRDGTLLRCHHSATEL
jgi:hypothetical protein